MRAHHEIRAAIAVQVAKRRAARPILRIGRRVLEHRRQFHCLAKAIARLTEKQAIAVPHEEIRPPVLIHIRHREPRPKMSEGNPAASFASANFSPPRLRSSVERGAFVNLSSTMKRSSNPSAS